MLICLIVSEDDIVCCCLVWCFLFDMFWLAVVEIVLCVGAAWRCLFYVVCSFDVLILAGLCWFFA